jgi:hypothetical protein
MSPITTSGTDITLTPRQVEEWPKAVDADTPVHRWPKGRPVSFSVPSLERAVPISRILTVLWLDVEGIRDEWARYATLLVMSELMTNAIEHTASARVTGRLRRTDNQLLVEVHDQGSSSSVPRLRYPDHAEDHGRGLALVAEFVLGWGMRLGADGGCMVWATVPLAQETGGGDGISA